MIESFNKSINVTPKLILHELPLNPPPQKKTLNIFSNSSNINLSITECIKRELT